LRGLHQVLLLTGGGISLRKESNMGVYVAEDGNYGNADGMIILPDDLTYEEEVAIVEASDMERNKIAASIVAGTF
jgi:hypothetical protein